MHTARLTLQHWLSPAFPTGAFTCSHGMEQLVAEGAITDARDLQGFIETVLRHGGGWQDGVLIGLALVPGADIEELDMIARALQPCAERMAETCDQGAAFVRTVSAVSGRNLPARPLPLAVAEAARPLNLPAADVIATYWLALITNLATIGIRHIPLGQSAGHGVIARLLPAVSALAPLAAMAHPDDLATSALAADLAAMAHETLQPRLYRT
jgi:urease accessory protein